MIQPTNFVLTLLAFFWAAASSPQPADFESCVRLGQYYLDRKEPGRAANQFEAAVRLKPEAASAHYNLGVALRLWGDLQGAEAALRQSLRLQPRFPEAHFVLGLVQGDRVGDEKLGLAEFEAAVAQDASLAEAHFNIGIIHWKSNEADRAVESFRRAVAEKSNSAEFRFRLGQALAKAGKNDDAARELERALELDPAHESAPYQLALVYTKLGEQAKAAALTDRIGRMKAESIERDRAGLDYRKAMGALERGQTEAAIKLLSEMLKTSRDEARLRTALGIAYQRTGNLAAAHTEFRRVIQINPKSADNHLNLGVVRMRQGDAVGAEREFRAALNIDPNFSEAHFNLGLLMAAQKRWAEASDFLHRSLRLNPSNARAYWNLARVLRDSGDREGALKSFESARQLDRGLTEASLEYGKLLAAQGKDSQAVAVWRDALQRDPLNANLQDCLISALQSQGNQGEAEREREKYEILASSGYPQAVAHMNQGDFDQAIRQFEKMLQLHPELTEVRRSLAFALFAAGRYRSAAAAYLKLVEDHPTDSDLRLNLGIALEEVPSLDEARQQLEESLRLNPASAQAHYHLGLVYLAQKDKPRAMEHFHSARRLDPTLKPPQ